MGVKTLLLAVALTAVGAAFASDTSIATFVHVNPSSTSFWRTAPSRTFDIPVEFPEGADSATLSVRGSEYVADYADITTSPFRLTLPEASDEEHEDVYELTLTFNDEKATVRTARLGLVVGQEAGVGATARCVSDTTMREWKKAYGNVVMPVPRDMTALTAGGTPVVEGDKGFTGAQGWYAAGRIELGTEATFGLVTDEAAYEPTVVGAIRGGALIIVR